MEVSNRPLWGAAVWPSGAGGGGGVEQNIFETIFVTYC